MSRLSECLQLTLDALKISARGFETKANLPHMTVGGIMDGRHPRSERFDKLLAAIPRLDLRIRLITAYVLDDAPPSEVPAIEAILQEHLLTWHQEHDPSVDDTRVAEPEAPYRVTLSTAAQARLILDRLRAAVDAGDSELSHWLATTGHLLTSPHLPPDPAQEG
jgi:hypothetical protein